MLLEIRSQLEPTDENGRAPAPVMNPETLEIRRLQLREAVAAIDRQAQQLRRERDALSKDNIKEETVSSVAMNVGKGRVVQSKLGHDGKRPPLAVLSPSKLNGGIGRSSAPAEGVRPGVVHSSKRFEQQDSEWKQLISELEMVPQEHRNNSDLVVTLSGMISLAHLHTGSCA